MRMTFWEHLDDLRKTLIRVFAIIALGTIVSLIFYNSIFNLLTYPAKQLFEQTHPNLSFESIKHLRVTNQSQNPIVYQLPENAKVAGHLSHDLTKINDRLYRISPQGHIDVEQAEPSKNLVLLSPIEGTMLSLKISFWCGLIGTSPLWLWLIGRFVSPAIATNVKRLTIPFLLLSAAAMTLGFLFAFFITLPMANQFLYSFNSDIGQNFWSLTQYIDYTVLLLFAHGIVFELFIILLFLVHFGILTAEMLSSKRRHAIVASFILAAIFTPPDIFTQVLLAIPLIALFELSIFYARLRKKRLCLQIPQ